MQLKRIILVFFLFLNGICISQNERSQDQENITFRSYDANWKYFELEKPIQVKILAHLPSPALCGNLAFASVSIVQTEDNEVFRVLDLCNTANITKNQIVTIHPSQKPDFSVLLPFSTVQNPKAGKIEPYNIDEETLNTTYVTILEL